MWEKRLITNIEEVLPSVHAWTERGRIWLSGGVDPEKLRCIFGVVSFSPCVTCKIADLESTLLAFCKDAHLDAAHSFALRVKRVGSHSFSSQELAESLGSLIQGEYPQLTVNLTNPGKEIGIEIRQDKCYIFDTIIFGPRGIPQGVEGTVVSLISGGIDSPVAAYLMMKRGCKIIPILIDMPLISDETVIERANQVVEILKKYQPDISLRVIQDTYLSDAQQFLREKREDRYTCLICKRRMYTIASQVAEENSAQGIVTGESLGQVASQTLDNLFILSKAITIPIYRPLIGLDKEEIIEIARRIGTFTTSTSLGASCRGTPKKPATTADLVKIENLEREIKNFLSNK